MSRHNTLPPSRSRNAAARWTPTRLGITAGITVFLLLSGTGASYAWWQANAGAGSISGAATVGVTQSLAASPSLAHTYTAAAPVAVGVVTVTNTSSRAGTYTTVLTATSTSTTVRGAVAVEVGTAASCTTTATLGSAVTGTLASPVTHSGSLVAGESVALCVRTTMTGTGITANTSATLTASAASSVLVGTWSATAAAPATFVQSVSSGIDPGAWYWVKRAVSPERCVETSNWSGASGTGTQSANCSTDAIQLWRFTPTSGGYYKIVSKNSPTLWWSVPSAASGQPLQITAGTGNTQQWSAVANVDGTYTFTLRANSTLCAARTGNGNNASMTIATCAAGDVLQAFTLAMFNTATPTPIVLTCTGDASTQYFSWPQLVGYEAEVTYQVLVNGAVDSVHTRATGWDPTAQFASGATLAAYGPGAKTIEVQQSVAGTAWSSVGTGSLVVSNTAPVLQCGS